MEIICKKTSYFQEFVFGLVVNNLVPKTCNEENMNIDLVPFRNITINYIHLKIKKTLSRIKLSITLNMNNCAKKQARLIN